MHGNFLGVPSNSLKLMERLTFFLIMILLLIHCQSTNPNISKSGALYTDYKIFNLGFTITLPSKWSIFDRIDHIEIANMDDLLTMPEDIREDDANGFVSSIYLSSLDDVVQIYTRMYDIVSSGEPMQAISTLTLKDFVPISTLHTDSEFESLQQQFNTIFDIPLTIDARYLYYRYTIVLFIKNTEYHKNTFLILRPLSNTQVIVAVCNTINEFIDNHWPSQWVRGVNTIHLIQ